MTPPTTILTAVMTTLNVTMKELSSPRRPQHLAEARLTAAYLLLTEGNMGRDKVGKLFRRSPAWVAWALYRCPALGEVDKQYAKRVENVWTAMKGATAAA